MAGYRSTQIRKPGNDTEFEVNCVILFSAFLNDPNVHRLGTSGQAQAGVDIVGHRDGDAHQIVGIQCKLKSGRSKLTASEVHREVTLALAYTPPLAEYFIVATSKDDTKLAQLAQELTQEQAATGRPVQIVVWGWDTLQEKIQQYDAAKKAFDPGFSPSLEVHDRKLDTILLLQERAATQEQVAALERRIAAVGSTPSLPLPAEFAQRELDVCLSRTLRRRGFGETDTPGELAALADRAISGDLPLASSSLRAEVCDRAARANGLARDLVEAQRFRAAAATIDPSHDLSIADAVLSEVSGNLDAALRSLRSRADHETRSALLSALIRHRGSAAALDWLREQGLGMADAGSLGVLNLVIANVHGQNFDQALAIIDASPVAYLDQCPCLRLLRAQLNLAAILPSDQKEFVLNGLPLNPRHLQLAPGAEGQSRITAATEDIRHLIGLLAELDLEDRRAFFEEFYLWLRLEDASTKAAAYRQLSQEIVDPTKTLRRVRLALAYEVSFNAAALERHLTQQKGIGGWSSDERFAAFLIVCRSDDPQRICAFFESHHDDLFRQTDLPHSMLAGLEVEAFARTGRFDEARQHIARHTPADLTVEQATDLEKHVTGIESGNEIETLRQRYTESQNLTDLRLLVAALRTHNDLHQLVTFAPVLARATRRRMEFDLAIRCLFAAERHQELLDLTVDLPELVRLDDEYFALRGWTLYKQGRVMEARTVARDLLLRRRIASDRELAINTSIESGDWGHIQAILAREAQEIGSLSSTDLMRLARLALEADSPYMDQFRDAAIQVAPDDPQINLAAYVLETERSRTHLEERAHQWFQTALDKSGPDGPVRALPLKELIEQAPRWAERTQKISNQIRQAEMPLFLAARGANRQLMEVTLGRAIKNSAPDAPQIKYPVFAFSGARSLTDLSAAKTVAFDITALVTLDQLGLLDKALALFESPTIAPSTLAMLFTERQFLKVHQPSMTAQATRIQALISDRVEILPPNAGATSTKTVGIGHDLASMLLAAESGGGIVVRSAPVAKLGSFLEETVDMTAHVPILTDTLAVLRFLSDHGKIDSVTRSSAEAYLTRVDKGWGGGRVIDPTSIVYLDDLAVTYLDHTGLLRPLTQSVAKVVVSDSLDKKTREDVLQGNHAEAMLAGVERIQASIAHGVENGSTHFSRRHRSERKEGETRDSLFDTVPTLDLLSDLSNINVVIADDRGLNKLPTWTDSSGCSAAAASTMDILHLLRKSREIDDFAYWQARHRLRVAGYYAVPLEAAELVHHLSRAPATDGPIRETPELRAIRESIAMALVHDCILPSEREWTGSIRIAVYMAIRDLWRTTLEVHRAEAQSDWLVSIQPEPLEWCLNPESDVNWAAAIEQTAAQIGMLLFFSESNRECRRNYYDWLNRKVGELLPSTRPEIREALISFLKIYVAKLVED